MKIYVKNILNIDENAKIINHGPIKQSDTPDYLELKSKFIRNNTDFGWINDMNYYMDIEVPQDKLNPETYEVFSNTFDGLIELIKSCRQNGFQQNDVLNLMNKFQDKDNIGLIIDYILSKFEDNKYYDSAQEDLLFFKKYIDPKLLLEVILEKATIDNFQNLRVLLPREIVDDFNAYYSTAYRINQFDKTIQEHNQILQDFTSYHKTSLIGNFEELIAKAKHIFDDQTQPLKNERDAYIKNNNLDILKSKLDDKVNSIQDDLVVEDYKIIEKDSMDLDR